MVKTAIRHVHQWASVLPPHLLPVVFPNARNATFPREEFISASCDALVSSLKPFVRGHQPLLSNDTLADLLRQYSAEVLEQNTTSDNRKLEEANLILQGLHLSSSVWDKQPCHLHAVCSVHSDVLLAQLTVMCPDFSLLGAEVSKGGAEMFILNSTLQSACTSGILDFANRQRLWSQDLLDHKSIEACVFLGKHRHQAPRAVHLLKWKTCEHLADWRWWLAVSHKFHPLRRTSSLNLFVSYQRTQPAPNAPIQQP